jgi:addiction module antidote-like protein
VTNIQAARELLTVEYDRLKSEQIQRIGFRDNLLFVHLAATGAIASWALTNVNTGLGRESLYRALSPEGNLEFATVLKVVRALGLRLHAATGPS